MTGLNTCLLLIFHIIADLGKAILKIFDWTKNTIKTDSTNNSMSNPKVSIIVPVYKVPKQFLVQCIESCTNQTLKDIEIILVDDGSLDDSGRVCDEYAAKDNRVKVIHKQNGGLVSARNAGYDVAIGEWQMYLDGDDWIDTDTCEKLMDAIERHPNVDIVFWNCVQELGTQSVKGKWEWSCKDEEHVYEGDECKELALNTLIYKSGIATAYSKLIRSSYAKEKGIFHDKRLKQGSEGLEFSLRAFYNAKEALFVREYYNHYRYNPNSISKKVDEKNTKYLIDCYDVIWNDIQGYVNSDRFRAAFYQRVVYVLIAIAMGTYFHPSNHDGLLTKVRKYSAVINDNEIFKMSVAKAPTTGMDKLRKITLAFIRMRMYFMLDFIAKAKQYFLKRGKFNY